MLRRIISFVFLLTLVGTYAAPLAGAFVAAQVADCCANGMCPMHRNGTTKHPQREKMPMCDRNKRSDSSIPACQASPCSMQEKAAVGVNAYLLPMPARLVFSEVTTIFLNFTNQLFHMVSQLPETPPPRI